MDIIGQLTKEQYLRWKNAILEMQNAELSKKLSEKTLALMDKQVENSQLRNILYKQEISSKMSAYDEAKKAYEETRKSIESELGVELTDCIIDEITLEIKK
jgi:hypothetical protein